MHFKILCMLLLIKSIQIDARGRMPLQSEINTTESIDLPRGFIPEPSPINPLLYPFVTENPIKTGTGTTSGWRPILTNRTTTKIPVLRSLMNEHQTVSQRLLEDHKTPDAPVMESIVYGTWKSEGPTQPELSQSKLSKTENETTINNETTPIYKNVMRRRLGGFIERIEPILGSSEKSVSIESEEQTRNSSKLSHKKHGRRKILKINENKSNESHKPKTVNSMEIVKVNSSFPELLNIAKQINESVEKPKPISKNQPNEESYAPKLRNSNSNISKKWPIAFMNSNEDSDAQDSSSQDNFNNFLGNTSLNLDKLFAPTTSFNITNMGIPYEDQNSAEEPSICVPLAVRERSVSNPNEIVNVERVYCFPLPVPSDTERIDQNETATLDKDADLNVLNYEELSIPSRGVYIKAAISVISISFLLI